MPMATIGELARWSRWFYIFLVLIFQVGVTYVFFNSHSKGWMPETKSNEVITISRNQSAMTCHPSTPKHDLPSSTEPLIILLWTWPRGSRFPLNQCPPEVDSTGCFFTVNRTMYPLAQAVVIHHRDVSQSINELPPMPRPVNQYWIWFNIEPPTHLKNLTIMDNVINLTMSYRTDSDIFTPYGWLEKHNGSENFTVPRKTKLVAWVASNWNSKMKRIAYYEQLKNYIQIDVYGKNHASLPRDEQHYKTLSEYKFYLAFENYNHEDYITEKLWRNSFFSGSVPVVMGPPRKNYERFIVPDSFIHVDDFSSPQELASYLMSLDKDDQKYHQYFNWRSKYSVPKPRRSWVTQYCKVCGAIKVAPPYRTFPSIAEWFK